MTEWGGRSVKQQGVANSCHILKASRHIDDEIGLIRFVGVRDDGGGCGMYTATASCN